MSRVDARRLEVFRVVVEAGAITLAAKRLHLSQPAVTAAVQQLEEALGETLLERRARGVVPTEAGRRLLPYASKVSVLLEEAALEVGAPRSSSGPVVLGASTTIAAYVVPQLLAAFAREVGQTPVRVQVGNTQRVLEWVASGEVPLGLVEGLTRAPRLRLAPYVADELLPVIARDAPRALAHIRSVEALTNVPILWREPGSGTREVVERALRRIARRRPAAHDLELGSTEAIVNAVRLGLGVGFVSRFALAEDLASGRVRALPLASLRIPRTFSFAWSGALTGTSAHFHAFALAHPPGA